MNYQHATEIIEALKTDPSSVDFWSVGQWRPITCVMNNFQFLCLGTLGNPERVRIRPTPRKVPFGPEDIKPGMVFRVPSNGDIRFRVPHQVETDGIRWTYDTGVDSWIALKAYWEYSTDGVTWAKCEKDEVVK